MGRAVRIKQASHHKPPSLNLEKQENRTSAARPAQGLDPAVVPFLDALAELGARAVLRDLERREPFKLVIRPPRLRIVPRDKPLPDKPEFVLARRRP